MQRTTSTSSYKILWMVRSAEYPKLGLRVPRQHVGISRCYGRNDVREHGGRRPGKASSAAHGCQSGGVVVDRIELASTITLPSTE